MPIVRVGGQNGSFFVPHPGVTTKALSFPQLWQTSMDWIYFKAPSVISLRCVWLCLLDYFWYFSKFEYQVLSSHLWSIMIENIC